MPSPENPSQASPDSSQTGVTRLPTSAQWAATVGYCRALRAGNRILVSGTAPVNVDGTTHAPGDPYRQMVRCLEIVSEALRALGGSVTQVIRTRIYVTDVETWEAVGRAHGEVFAAAPPVTTLVEVKGLVDPEMMVEMEAEAWLGPDA